MKTYPLNEARAEFSKLVERALAGEPQRVTRYGKEAVVIVSEDEWRARRRMPTLGALLAQHARARHISEPMTHRRRYGTAYRTSWGAGLPPAGRLARPHHSGNRRPSRTRSVDAQHERHGPPRHWGTRSLYRTTTRRLGAWPGIVAKTRICGRPS